MEIVVPDYIQCSICSLHINKCVTFDCLHSICDKCIVGSVDACPICTRETQKPDNVTIHAHKKGCKRKQIGRSYSCHQCKNNKPIESLFFCQFCGDKSKMMRPCHKKYCHGCLSRNYDGFLSSYNTQKQPWICPACSGMCSCALCKRTKTRRCTPKKQKIQSSEEEVIPEFFILPNPLDFVEPNEHQIRIPTIDQVMGTCDIENDSDQAYFDDEEFVVPGSVELDNNTDSVEFEDFSSLFEPFELCDIDCIPQQFE